MCSISVTLLCRSTDFDQKETATKQMALKTMQKATRYFISKVAVNGGYLYNYKTDFSMREGENIATPSTVWLEPPGTPAVGMVFLEAYEATGDILFLNAAIKAGYALTWGQLASGGWDNLIDFDPVESRKWHYRRDVEKGDTVTGRRRNRSTLDDNKTQSALKLLMRLDKVLNFENDEIHRAVLYGLDALLDVQYPNGAWPQQFSGPPDPAEFPVCKACFPAEWSREYPGASYAAFYTFNDNTISDVIKTMTEAWKIYGDERYLKSAESGGDFIILAQMPEPQSAWAQQYNINMEPAWARKFEPPSVTGGETFGILQTLLDLYLETGESRFLEPVPKAIAWAKRSLLPDGRLARFYELQTNRPLYFNAPRQHSNLPEPAFPNLADYTLIYEDTDLPTHYAFKVPGERLKSVENYYNRILREGRSAILAERDKSNNDDIALINEIINSLDEEGRWVETGRLKTGDPDKPYIEAEIISTRTFNRNMSLLTSFIKNQR